MSNRAPIDFDLFDWLLDSDPALRWQVERDLLSLPEEIWKRTRSRVWKEGFGARLLNLQDADGQWDGGAFFPRNFDFSTVKSDGQPWTATTWTLNSLREWGLDANILGDTAERLERNSRWEYENLPFWQGEVDCCINSYTLSNGTWLGRNMSELVQWFVDHQLAEGGWNCDWIEGSVRSSFHSTLNSLKGLLYFEKSTGGTDASKAARKAGEEYLLRRKLLYKLDTDQIVAPWVTEMEYPMRWRYSVLKALDYFREVSLYEGTTVDIRLDEPIHVLRKMQQSDGTFLQGRNKLGKTWFEVDAPTGEPSKWLTFLAQRVLSTMGEGEISYS